MSNEMENCIDKIGKELSTNTQKLKDIFCYPINESFNIREVYIYAVKKKGCLIYLKGTVNEQLIDEFIIEKLIREHMTCNEVVHDLTLIKRIISAIKFTEETSFKQITKKILEGHVVLLIDGIDSCLVIEVTKYEQRAIGRSETENVIKGPHESFVEFYEINISLIRKYVKSAKLVNESVEIGLKETCKVQLVYREDIADPKLISNIKARLGEIKSDELMTSAVLGQYIEDNSYSIVPTVLFTELPDRAAAFIKEGYVVILPDNSPSVIIAPATFWSFFHTPEDTYHRWIAGNFIRILRLAAMTMTLLTPAIYIGLTNFHPEMIPTDLLLAIAASREKVPFPVIFEVIGMEIAFEIIREASIRIPTSIGSTIGIVGALILGQAAVQANIISPLIVIVVSITGVASFIISNVDLNMSVRIARFYFLACAILMGFLGIAVGIVIFFGYIISIKSFGVPFLAPVTPHYDSSRDMYLRSVIKKQMIRPLLTNLKIIYKRKPTRKE